MSEKFSQLGRQTNKQTKKPKKYGISYMRIAKERQLVKNYQLICFDKYFSIMSLRNHLIIKKNVHCISLEFGKHAFNQHTQYISFYIVESFF